jgi:fumarate reductase flavoprotein subunit
VIRHSLAIDTPKKWNGGDLNGPSRTIVIIPAMAAAVDFDVIVIGGGAAGMTAAIAAREAGATVALLEACDRLGGSAALSGGHLYAAGTRYQREAGIDDDPERLFYYYRSVNGFQVEPALIRAFGERSAAAIDWAVAHGVRLLGLEHTDMSPVLRGHRVEGYGAGLAEALERAVAAAGAEVVYRTRVRELALEGDRVVGVRVAGELFRAEGVVVASGGFARNQDLLAAHYPAGLAGGDWTGSPAGEGSRGDSLELAAQAGADLLGQGRGLATLRPRVTGIWYTGRFVLVNGRGRRFIDEGSYTSVVSEAVRQQGARAFVIFDEDGRVAHTGEYDTARPFHRDDLRLDWVGTARRAQETGLIVGADTPAALARGIGADPAVLSAALDRYNAACERGGGDELESAKEWLAPIRRPPFYAVEVRPACVILTGFGMRIDTEARVLTPAGDPVPGLFAAGEAVGNYYGQLYPASGSSITAALVFGAVAGRNAAAGAPVAVPR